MNPNAMRAPSPVLMNPREMKKASTISQMTVLPNPESASPMVSVPVAAVAAMPTIATAPMGRGLSMIPMIVATKMASRWIAFGSTPSGAGRNHNATAAATGASSLITGCRARGA